MTDKQALKKENILNEKLSEDIGINWCDYKRKKQLTELIKDLNTIKRTFNEHEEITIRASNLRIVFVELLRFYETKEKRILETLNENILEKDVSEINQKIQELKFLVDDYDNTLIKKFSDLNNINSLTRERHPFVWRNISGNDLKSLIIFYEKYKENEQELNSEKLNSAIKKKFNFDSLSEFFEWIEKEIYWFKYPTRIIIEEKLIEAKEYFKEKYSAEFSDLIFKLPKEEEMCLELWKKIIKKEVIAFSFINKKTDINEIFDLFFCRFIIIELKMCARIHKNISSEKLFGKLTKDNYTSLYNKFNSENDDCNWTHKKIKELAVLSKKAIKDLRKKYPSAQYLFIARDGVLFYQMMKFLDYHNDADIVFISKDSLNIRNELKNRVEELIKKDFDKFSETFEKGNETDFFKNIGIRFRSFVNKRSTVENLIKTIMRFIRHIYYLKGQNKLDKKNTELFYYIDLFNNEVVKNYLNKFIKKETEVVFFDSSSKTFPVLLAAFCNFNLITNNNLTFFPYFALSDYDDENVRSTLMTEENEYFSDTYKKMFRFNGNTSTFFPYEPKLFYTNPFDYSLAFLISMTLKKNV